MQAGCSCPNLGSVGTCELSSCRLQQGFIHPQLTDLHTLRGLVMGLNGLGRFRMVARKLWFFGARL